MKEEAAERTDEKKAEENGCAFILFFLFVAMPTTLLWQAFVLSKIYAWFIESVTHVEIGLWRMLGIVLFVGIWRARRDLRNDRETVAEMIRGLLVHLVGFTIILGMAFLAHRFAGIP